MMKPVHISASTLLVVIFALPLFVTPAHSQWATDPNVNNPVCDAPLGQLYPEIISDGAGGAIMTWDDLRNTYSDANIYAQKIDSAGSIQWTVNGATLCDATRTQKSPTMATDGSGGAIIAWADFRDIEQLYDIFAQKIDSLGVVQWATNGIPVCSTTDAQYQPIIGSDGFGGAIIAWHDFQDNLPNSNIYAQRINSAGVEQWPTNGIRVSSMAGEEQFLAVIGDGTGGAIFIWEDNRQGGGLTNIYAQRIDSTGGVQWAAGGVKITNDTNGVIPTSISDGSGGAIITWMDYRDEVSYQIYAQKIDLLGVVQWASGGVAIRSATNSGYHPTIASDGSGGAIITWEDMRVGALGFDIYAQKINSTGAVQWAVNGMAVCTATGDQVVPVIDSDGSGGAVITWGDKRGGGIYGDIYSQKLDTSGVEQWTHDGVTVCTASRDQNTPAIVNDGSGGAIITWGDDRNHYLTAFDIYAQRVNTSGDLGDVSDVPQESGISQNVILSQNFPNPFNPMTTIQYTLPTDASVQLKIYDISGREIAQLVNEDKTAGRYEVEFNAESLASGMYFYRIQAGNFVDTKKIALLK